jgi:carbon storage regulator
MLILSRKVGETILVGDEISVTVVRIAPGAIRIGVEAPPNMTIIRGELRGKAMEPEAAGPVVPSPACRSGTTGRGLG